MDVNNVTSPEFSIDPATASTNEPLANFTWSQFRRLTTPISEFSFVGKPLKRLEWRGSYLFYRYQGPVSFDQSFNGIAPNSTNVQTPYAVSQSVRGNVTEPDHIISQGFTYDINSWWSVQRRLSLLAPDQRRRWALLTVSSTELLRPPTLKTSSGAITSAICTSPWTSPRLDTLVIRPGVHFMKYDVATFSAGVEDHGLSHTIKTASPEISFGYEPSKMFSIRGDLHSSDSGVSYTAITPHTQSRRTCGREDPSHCKVFN